jgi:signal transduction histidine kinase
MSMEAQLQRALREQRSEALELVWPISERWVELHIYPTGHGLAVYFRDISSRKQMEQELQRAQESLRTADRLKDEFLALLARELRNPLAPIGNGLTILQGRTITDPVTQRTVEMMGRQLKHLVRLVDDLLDVSRITRGKLELRARQVLLTEVLTSSLESCRESIEAHGHKVIIDIRAQDLMVDADPDRLVQVFANLLSNSAKYTDRGGRICVALERVNNEAAVAVTDNGMGIPPDLIDNVFQMFSQGRAHAAHAKGGLGIGLALVKMLVQMHDRSVAAASAGLGLGSTFTVRLPLCGVPRTGPDSEHSDPTRLEDR